MIKIKDCYEDIKQYLSEWGDFAEISHSSFLVTGGAGLICSALIDMLICLNESENMQIQIYVAGRSKKKVQERFLEYADKNYFHFVPYDATKPVAFDFSVDYIIQGASPADPKAISQAPVDTLLGNVYGMAQILDYAHREKVKRCLYISSSEVYGKNETGESFREENYGFVDFLNPRASYPMGKRAAENLCLSYMAQYGLDTVIVRPGHIYGPTITLSDSRATAQFTRSVAKGQSIVMKSAGTQLRSYCYVYDCATAILTVLLRGKSGEAYNISNPNAITSIRHMAELFSKWGNVELTFEVPDEAEQKSYNLMDMSALNSEKLEALGWHGLTDANEGVQKTLEYYV